MDGWFFYQSLTSLVMATLDSYGHVLVGKYVLKPALLDLLVDCFKAGLDHLGPWLKVLTMAQKVFNTMKVTRINFIIIHAHEPKCAK